jgi:Protein of unknown function (DUF4235)
MKLLFRPVSIVSGLLAGLVGKKLFERVWALVDEKDPPQPDQRGVSWPKLVAALMIEGAVFRLVKGAVDHVARGWFAGLTGRWPGTAAGDKPVKH